MIYRFGNLPPDISYIIDGATELGDISGDVAEYFHFFKPDTIEWFDRHSGSKVNSLTNRMIQTYQEERHTLTNAERLYCSLVSVRYCTLYFEENFIQDIAASSLIKSYRQAKRDPQKALALAQTTKQLRHALTRDFFNKRFLSHVHRTFNYLTIDGKAASLQEAASIRSMIIGGVKEWYKKTHPNSFFSKSISKHQVKAKRKVITKSYSMAESILGKETARMFVSDKEITFTGKHFGFKVKKVELGNLGHGAIDIMLTDKDGVELSNLCVFADQAPALDQLTTLALHVMYGDDLEIVRTANLFNKKEAAYENELLKELHPKDLKETDLERFVSLREKAFPSSYKFREDNLSIVTPIARKVCLKHITPLRLIYQHNPNIKAALQSW